MNHQDIRYLNSKTFADKSKDYFSSYKKQNEYIQIILGGSI